MAALLSNCMIVAGTIIFPDYWTGSGLDQDKPLRPDQWGWGQAPALGLGPVLRGIGERGEYFCQCNLKLILVLQDIP